MDPDGAVVAGCAVEVDISEVELVSVTSAVVDAAVADPQFSLMAGVAAVADGDRIVRLAEST